MKDDRITLVDKDGYEHTLYRIKALKDVSPSIPKGTIGGYIEKEENLSHEGTSWVSKNACVFGNASVFGKVRVYGDACVFEEARVFGTASVFGEACLYGKE